MKPAVIALAALLCLAGCRSPAPRQPSPSASPSAAPTPTFTDVYRGDTESVVKLLAYDPRARSAVVEPVVFMQGPDFCEAFHVPGTDPRCEREWVTEDSRTKVTLPVGAKVKLLSVGGGDPECIDSGTGAGACRMSAADLGERIREDPGYLVRLSTADGTVTKIAEVYLP